MRMIDLANDGISVLNSFVIVPRIDKEISSELESSALISQKRHERAVRSLSGYR